MEVTDESLTESIEKHEKNNLHFMNNIPYYIALLLLSFQVNVFAQSNNSNDSFNVVISEIEGDLNHDGEMDQVLVEMDTVNQTQPLRLQIFLSQANGKSSLEISSTNIIEPQYPIEKLGEFNAYQIPSFFIENGILSMWSEMKAGNVSYDFKYQNGSFELIRVTKITNNSSKGYVDEHTVFTETNFNLITGIRTETDGKLGSKEVLNERTTTILIRPLPTLQDFHFSDKNNY